MTRPDYGYGCSVKYAGNEVCGGGGYEGRKGGAEAQKLKRKDW